MPTARICATAVGYNSMLMVFGGRVKVKNVWTAISTVDLLDTTIGCWYACNNLPKPQYQCEVAVVNNTVYLLGGVSVDDESSLQVFSASLATLSTHQLKWQSLNDTPWHFSYPVRLSILIGSWRKALL